MPTQRTHTNLALRYAAASHVGKVWTNNEDAAYAGPSLLAVADGMGGHAAGEAANQAGGPDNVTAVVADVTGGPAPRSPVLVVGGGDRWQGDRMTGNDPGTGAGDDSTLVRLRCSVIVFRDDEVLLVQRVRNGGDWVLPGGCPRPGEGMAACARREVLEETGLRVDVTRVAFALEAIGPNGNERTIEIVFLAAPVPSTADLAATEPGLAHRVTYRRLTRG